MPGLKTVYLLTALVATAFCDKFIELPLTKKAASGPVTTTQKMLHDLHGERRQKGFE